MKLKEVLKLYQGKQIKIGADISFMYCEICDENIWDIIQKLSDERHKFIQQKLINYKEYLKNFDKFWNEKLQRQLNNAKLNKLNRFEIQELKERWQFEKTEDYRIMKARLEKYTEFNNNWIPFLEREVLETYDSIIYDCKIIKIEGKEIGNFWDKDEYNKRGDMLVWK